MENWHKFIESTIGRLNYVGYILPHARYFLNRLRHMHNRCVKYLCSHTPLSSTDRGTFQTITKPASRNYLLDRLISERIDQTQGVAPWALQQQLGSLVQWRKFCSNCDIQDIYLEKFTQPKKSASCQHLRGMYAEMSLASQTKPHLLEVQFRLPLHTYVRSFERTYGLIPALTHQANAHCSSDANFKVT